MLAYPELYAAMDQEGESTPVQSNDVTLLQLMERTKYNIVQENGQRKYGGPPPNWTAPPPPKGSEVFVGKIPRDCFEDELVPVFEKVGKIYELRLMMDFSGSNRGYAFVMFTCAADAHRAIKELNNFEIRKGRFLGVVKSVDNCRLFVGGIPKNKTKEEIFVEMKKVTDGVLNVILYSSVVDKTKSRGFAFVEYENHRSAAMARRKLIPGKIQLWGHEIAVDWAEPEPEVDEETMSKVTVLYVRNLMLNTSEDQIRDAFNKVRENSVEKVKKLRDFAFVHFRTREDAENALEAMNDTLLDNSVVEVTWAKPADKCYLRYSSKSSNKVVPFPNNNGSYPNSPPGTATAIFSPPPTYDNSTFVAAFPYNQTMSSPSRGNPGPVSSPGRGRGRGAAGLRDRGYSSNYIRSNQAKRCSAEPRYFDLMPGVELVPINPYIIKSSKPPAQILQEMCQKNNWGEPVYHLHTAMQRNGGGGDNVPLFLYKITLPSFQLGQYNVFQPTKLSRSIDEAKQIAAENVLAQLGLTLEGMETNPGLISIHPSAAAVYPQGRAISGAPAPTLSYPPPPSGVVANATYVLPSAKLTPYEQGYFDGPQTFQVATPQPIY